MNDNSRCQVVAIVVDGHVDWQLISISVASAILFCQRQRCYHALTGVISLSLRGIHIIIICVVNNLVKLYIIATVYVNLTDIISNGRAPSENYMNGNDNIVIDKPDQQSALDQDSG